MHFDFEAFEDYKETGRVIKRGGFFELVVIIVLTLSCACQAIAF